MNFELELHDSTLAGVDVIGRDVIIRLDPAYLYRSEGRPRIDRTTGWQQNLNLVISDGVVEALPAQLPCWLAEGALEIDGVIWDNIIPLPVAALGAVVFRALTAQSEPLVVRGTRAEAVPAGEPRYLEDIPFGSDSGSDM